MGHVVPSGIDRILCSRPELKQSTDLAPKQAPWPQDRPSSGQGQKPEMRSTFRIEPPQRTTMSCIAAESHVWVSGPDVAEAQDDVQGPCYHLMIFGCSWPVP